jgi:hypothetical protein
MPVDAKRPVFVDAFRFGGEVGCSNIGRLRKKFPSFGIFSGMSLASVGSESKLRPPW